MLKLILIPLIGAFIGYITNVFAVRLLFRPKYPVNLYLYELQGLLPKRQAEIAHSLGTLVEDRLLNLDDMMEVLERPEVHDRIIDKMVQVMRERVTSTLQHRIPGKLIQVIVNAMEKLARQESYEIVKQAIAEGQIYLEQEIHINQIVEDKMNSFDLDELEKIIFSVSGPELRFIEIMGGVLGLIIGIIQALIVYAFPVDII